MLRALATLLLCQFAGEIASTTLSLPIPGPVIGMVLLFAALLRRRRPDRELETTAQGLLLHLPLLYVPAGVGVVTQLDVLRHTWLPVAVAILVSTALGLLVTGWVMQALSGPELPDA